LQIVNVNDASPDRLGGRGTGVEEKRSHQQDVARLSFDDLLGEVEVFASEVDLASAEMASGKAP
jgi:hypothetical protein